MKLVEQIRKWLLGLKLNVVPAAIYLYKNDHLISEV